jgi:SAM-dependent methyltransferase
LRDLEDEVMRMAIARQFLDDALLQLRKLKVQADKAMAQVDDRQFFEVLDREANSIALIVKHLAGNMRSRWTDFLTSDGEKPDRQRDREFLVEGEDTRAALTEAWEDGWQRVFDAISPLSPDDLPREVRIRGEAHTVLEAITRQLTHYAAHVGQIVLLAKHHAGPLWQTLSIPRGQSKEFVVASTGSAYGVPKRAPEAPLDEGEWQHFLAFLRTAPPVTGPQEMFQHYGRLLANKGVDQPRIVRRVGGLFELMRERPDAWAPLFDRIYASGAPNVVATPNPLLMSAAEGLAPGRALEVAVGHGRNAIALAALGWDVTGIDVSEEGLAAARAHAERAGVRLTLRREPDQSFDFGEAAWDLLAVIYGPVSITDPAYAARLHRAVKPGGLVVVESFASDRDSLRRRPIDIDPADLRRAFDAFRFVRFEDIDGVSEWDPQPTRLVRLIARR